jgi:hypothetical protein
LNNELIMTVSQRLMAARQAVINGRPQRDECLALPRSDRPLGLPKDRLQEH